MAREIRVESNGREVELKGFAAAIVANTVVALVGSLHDVDTDGEIRIVVKARRPSR